MRVLVQALVVLVAVGSCEGIAQLKLLDEYDQAKCLDGSPSGYYLDVSPSGSNKWILHLQGGGECASEDRCVAQSKTNLGSSTKWPKEMGIGFLQQRDPTLNPDFYDWNYVMMAYCSQDLHGGQITKPSNASYGLYFSGRLNFLAMIKSLPALSSASDIVLSGDSAGGIGVWYHLDWLAGHFSSARVVGAPIAGFYFYADPYMGVNHTSSGLADFREPAWPSHVELWDSFMDESCVSALGSKSWACMLANNSFPYIDTPVFITEAQTDMVVLLYHDWVPQPYVMMGPEQDYLAQWHENMSIALAPALASGRDGVFNPACFIHTGFSFTSPRIENTTYVQTLGNWYFNRPGPKRLFDECGVMCNPTCPQ